MKLIIAAVLLPVGVMFSSLPQPVFAQAGNRIAMKVERVNGPSDRIVRIRVEIKNISQQDIQIYRSAPWQDFTVSVTGPDGKPAGLTKLGEKLQSTVPNGSHVLVTLPPQQTLSSEWNVSDWVNFSAPGTHRITVAPKFDTINETVTSNTLEVKIP